jgi:putative iron-regulated protein
MFKYHHLLLFFCLLGGLLLPVGCNKNDNTDEIETLKKAVLNQYADLVLAGYEDACQTALTLQQRIDAFVAAPTAAGFQQCKDAWLAARNPYGQTEAFRFYGGPIDDANGPEGLINAWPMDENFIDYVAGNATAGLINQPAAYPEISKQVLMDLNESISEESIFTGYHAIEFLLWGQDLSTTGPGERPYTDFVTGGTAQNQQRRGQYLRVVADLLTENLQYVRDQWTVGAAYRQAFLNDTSTPRALGFLFTSLGELSKGELSGERMFVAVDTQDQENEHSCFSDNTITDIQMNFLGLKNVYFGRYKKVDGTELSGQSLHALAERLDPVKAAAARAAFETAEAKINAIPAPFDQTIVQQPALVIEAITALRSLSDRLADVGLAVGATF